jgi:hypothetical protein
MSGRPTREVTLAVAYCLRTPGALPRQAAKTYKCSVRAVQRGLAAAGAARPIGRPATVKEG